MFLHWWAQDKDVGDNLMITMIIYDDDNENGGHLHLPIKRIVKQLIMFIVSSWFESLN